MFRSCGGESRFIPVLGALPRTTQGPSPHSVHSFTVPLASDHHKLTLPQLIYLTCPWKFVDSSTNWCSQIVFSRSNTQSGGVATISNFIGPAKAWEKSLRNGLDVEGVMKVTPGDVQSAVSNEERLGSGYLLENATVRRSLRRLNV